MGAQSTGGGPNGPVPIKQNPDMTAQERRYYFVVALIGLFLAILFTSFVAWVTYLVVVKFFGQETITFWVALPSAILFWFMEEMLQLTLPCRRALRRLAHWLAKCWVQYLARDRSKNGGPTEHQGEFPLAAPAAELRIHDPPVSSDDACSEVTAVSPKKQAI